METWQVWLISLTSFLLACNLDNYDDLFGAAIKISPKERREV